MFHLFDLAWGLRNEAEHGADLETQRMIRLDKCERAIRRLYHAGESLPHRERHPFRYPMEVVLSKYVCTKKRWVSMTEDYIPAAKRRGKVQAKKGQRSLKEFGFLRHTQSEMVGIRPFISHFTCHLK
jgi:hypothetical protein